MEHVETKVLDGLLEGLVLHAIEREPSHGYGILKDLEAAMGAEPSKNRVYRLLRDLEEEGYVDSEEVTEASRTRQVYSLTEEGSQRLGAYRDLPAPFKTWLAGLFEMDGPREVPTPDGDGHADAREEEPSPATERGWVHDRLAELPPGAAVRARHAEYKLERSPGQARWRFVVERHEPGDHEGAEEGPLTFVYLAIQRLLYEPP